MRRRALIGAVLIAALAFTGCSSDKPTADGEPPAAGWDAGARATAEQIQQRIGSALPGSCARLVEENRVEYLTIVQANMKTETPLFVASCDVSSEEALELSVFRDAAKRDAFIEGRSAFLCKQAQRRNVVFSGLRWAVDDAWSAQFDTEAAGRAVAGAIGADYKSTPCGDQQPDWDDAAVAEAQVLADKLEAAGLGCDDFTVLSRDEFRTKQRYEEGLPAAIGDCTIRKDAGVHIAVFNSSSIARDRFIAIEQGEVYCSSAPGATVIQGPDWALFMREPATAAEIAKTLGGETVRCPS